MKGKINLLLVLSLGIVYGIEGQIAWAQNLSKQTYRQELQFSDPSKIGTIKMELWYGDVNVRGANDKKVVVVYQTASRPLASAGNARFSRRGDLEVSELNNVIRVLRPPASRDFQDAMPVDVQVPHNSNLILTMLGGKVQVSNLGGEIEISNRNGEITIYNAANAAVVSTVNGNIKAVFNRVMPKAAFSFVTLNGDVDVTMPKDLKAYLDLQTRNGKVYSDFSVAKVEPVMGIGITALRGKVQNGEQSCKASTRKGNVYLRKAR